MEANMGPHRVRVRAPLVSKQAAGTTRGAPFPVSAGKLIPVPHQFDDGVACRKLTLHFAGNLARILIFVHADRRHHFLLPDQDTE
jgi:hypothetical protein